MSVQHRAIGFSGCLLVLFELKENYVLIELTKMSVADLNELEEFMRLRSSSYLIAAFLY